MTPGVFSTATLLDRIVLRPEEQAVSWNQKTWMVVVAGCTLLALALYRRTPMAVSFVLASISLFGTVVVAFSAAGNSLLPLPHRYVLELNVALVLAITWLANAVVARALVRAASRLSRRLFVNYASSEEESVETSLDTARTSARATIRERISGTRHLGKRWSIAVVAGTVLIGGGAARDFLIDPWRLQPA